MLTMTSNLRKFVPMFALSLAVAMSGCGAQGSGNGEGGESDRASGDFSTAAAAASITLSLINVDTRAPIAGFDPISDGAEINLQALPSRRLSIRANPSVAVGSVEFNFNGAVSTENGAPYTLCKDDGTYYYDCNFRTGSYTLTARAFSRPNRTGTVLATVTRRFTIVDRAVVVAPQVTALALIDADTNQPVPGFANLADGAVINLATLPTRNLNIQAVTNPTVTGSVRMGLDARVTTQGSAPYALCNDTAGDYLACPSDYFTVGDHVITARAYSEASLNGAVGAERSVRVSVIDEVPPPPAPTFAVSGFTLINADTNLPVAGYTSIANGATIDLAALPTRNLNIRVNTSPEVVGSVAIELDAARSTQGSAPYAVCNDSAGDYLACGSALGVGDHVVGATAYELAGLGGQSSDHVTVSFRVTDSGTSPEPTPTPDPTPDPTPTPDPEPTPTPDPGTGGTPVTVGGSLSAVWANDGGDKVTRDERRATSNASAVLNRLWDGGKVTLMGAKNEVVNFNLVLENKSAQTGNLSVTFDTLTGPNGAQIRSTPATGDGVYDWTQRPIELFYVRYLEIKGLSLLSYGNYDERHVPKRMRRPWSGSGVASGGWTDRPDHNKFYPEIAVPLETVGTFRINANENQSVWADIYVPKTAPAGTYTGTVTVREGTTVVAQVPVQLQVRNFALPDTPSAKTMLYVGYGDVSRRYTGVTWPNNGTAEAQKLLRVRDRHFMVAHRHKISLIDHNEGPEAWSQDAPRPAWVPRLNGSLFTAANGYDGPGVGVGNGVFSIGTYGSWGWRTNATESTMRTRTDAWENWFRNNAPSTERFLYLVDESTNYAQTETWASWVKNNPGVGGSLPTFATLGLPEAVNHVPSLDIAASWFSVASTSVWQSAFDAHVADARKKFMVYNGKRPASGSFATEDDGVALRELAWAQYKMKVHRWFFWESTYYNNYQGGTGQTNVFQSAFTFGGNGTIDPVRGQTGWNHSNGDGVLFYPGTDTVYPAESYGLEGPIASLRLKHWRRGIQDVDYLTLAARINPTRVQQIVQTLVPKALWEVGIDDPNDPTWKRTDISWSINPDDWEAARKELADIIENGQ